MRTTPLQSDLLVIASGDQTAIASLLTKRSHLGAPDGMVKKAQEPGFLEQAKNWGQKNVVEPVTEFVGKQVQNIGDQAVKDQFNKFLTHEDYRPWRYGLGGLAAGGLLGLGTGLIGRRKKKRALGNALMGGLLGAGLGTGLGYLTRPGEQKPVHKDVPPEGTPDPQDAPQEPHDALMNKIKQRDELEATRRNLDKVRVDAKSKPWYNPSRWSTAPLEYDPSMMYKPPLPGSPGAMTRGIGAALPVAGLAAYDIGSASKKKPGVGAMFTQPEDYAKQYNLPKEDLARAQAAHGARVRALTGVPDSKDKAKVIPAGEITPAQLALYEQKGINIPQRAYSTHELKSRADLGRRPSDTLDEFINTNTGLQNASARVQSLHNRERDLARFGLGLDVNEQRELVNLESKVVPELQTRTKQLSGELQNLQKLKQFPMRSIEQQALAAPDKDKFWDPIRHGLIDPSKKRETRKAIYETLSGKTPEMEMGGVIGMPQQEVKALMDQARSKALVRPLMPRKPGLNPRSWVSTLADIAKLPFRVAGNVGSPAFRPVGKLAPLSNRAIAYPLVADAGQSLATTMSPGEASADIVRSTYPESQAMKVEILNKALELSADKERWLKVPDPLKAFFQQKYKQYSGGEDLPVPK